MFPPEMLLVLLDQEIQTLAPTIEDTSPSALEPSEPVAAAITDQGPAALQGCAEADTVQHVQDYLRCWKSGVAPGRELAVVWEQFAGRYHPIIIGLCRRYPRADTEPEDMAQEIWKKLIKRLPNFRYDARYPSFHSWLSGFIRREVLGWPASRDPALHQGSSGDWDLALLLSRSASPADEHEANRLKRTVNQVLRKLEKSIQPSSYEVFRLRMLEEKSTTEVAAILRMRSRQVRERLMRVESKFQALMEQHPEFETIVEFARKAPGTS